MKLGLIFVLSFFSAQHVSGSRAFVQRDNVVNDDVPGITVDLQWRRVVFPCKRGFGMDSYQNVLHEEKQI